MAKGIIRNRSGAALLITVLAAAGTLTIVTYAIFQVYQYYDRIRQPFEESRKHRMAMGNVIDYVSYAIRQRWCLRKNLTQDSGCNIYHEGNLERFLLSPDTIADLNRGKKPSDPKVTALTRFESDRVSSFDPDHPLFEAMEALGGQYRIKVVLEDSSTVPDIKSFMRLGRESYLKVTAQAFRSGDIQPSMSTEALVSFTPRELSAFGLIAQGNLILDRSVRANDADIVFPDLATLAQNEIEGIHFTSPVFSNSSLVLPPADSPSRSEYYNVSFNDVVVLGSGKILRKNLASSPDPKPFHPESPGGAGNDFNYQLSKYGNVALAKGIRQDPTADPGLPYLFGKNLHMSNELLLACTDWNAIQNSFSLTRNSQLLIQQAKAPITGTVTDEYFFQLGLSHKNMFLPQGGLGQTQRVSGLRPAPGISLSRLNDSAFKRLIDSTHPGHLLQPFTFPQQDVSPVLRIRLFDPALYLSGRPNTPLVEADLPKDATLAIPLFPDPSAIAQTAEAFQDANPGVPMPGSRSDPCVLQPVACQIYNTFLTSPAEYCGGGAGTGAPDCPAVAGMAAPECVTAKALVTACHAVASAPPKLIIKTSTASRGDLLTLSVELQNRNHFPLRSPGTPGGSYQSSVTLEVLAFDISANNGSGISDRAAGALYGPNDPTHPNRLVFNLTGAQPLALQSQGSPTLESNSGATVTLPGVWRGFRSDSAFRNTGGSWSYEFNSYTGRVTTKGDLPEGPYDPALLSSTDPQVPDDRKCTHSTGVGGEVVFPLVDSDYFMNSTFSWNFHPPTAPFENEADGKQLLAGNLVILSNNSLILPNRKISFPMSVDVNGITAVVLKQDGNPDSPATDRTDVQLSNRFLIRSIADACVIGAGVNMVSGFLTCKKLIIPARTQPLVIRGTILAGELLIDRAAIQKGIEWSSIWHPNALPDLIQNNILTALTSTEENLQSTPIVPCDLRQMIAPNRPVWDPTFSGDLLDRALHCQVNYLRTLADPFRWTTVDPDCGIPNNPGATVSQPSCRAQYRARAFDLVEIWRKDRL